jgi:TldD protein
MKRRDFIQVAGMGAGAMLMPFNSFSNDVDLQRMLDPLMDVSQKKKLADVALNTTKALGATYTDVRIGRYLNQFVITRENHLVLVFASLQMERGDLQPATM